LLERALAEIHAHHPQAKWVAALSGKSRLAAGSPLPGQELVFVLLGELAGAGPAGPRELWFENDDWGVIAVAHPYGDVVAAVGFSPPLSPGAARRLARGLLGELAGHVGRNIAKEVVGEDEIEHARAAARARLEPILGTWFANRVTELAWQQALAGRPADNETLQRFESLLRRMGWGAKR